ncbi:hypothetical protein LTR02_015625 [Friedmanniomyces endolithicus]|nr:hypothetical protein LTR94_022443 [Friedmanniomyces endolithicus]KAK0768683.1 hypothetical protein LTR59_017498 [Friedmanniomyces endolithicus]KAK0773989.1 hypothetical protein LTR38_016381 [Friedmanniomyces endolithicus]KAK0801034.1 hypothetical protein LTR75_008666 [Friedmanniomyces endolithicus]KAK0832515.1 hypothetical protein LTR03_015159 [Friedmanniomyces endolithicus]
MGAKPSAPIPGTKLRVLALGLPRTGTSSISAALEILLNGPSYHGGAHMAQGSMSHMRKWMRCHRISYDARQQGRELTSLERARVLALLAEQYEGFASVSDTPAFYYAEELCEVFPEAVVVVTMRDVDAWWASKMEINALMRDWQRLKEVVLWPVPQGIGYWPAFSRLLLGGAYGEHLGRPGREVYERHVEEEHPRRAIPEVEREGSIQADFVGEASAGDVLLGYISRCWGDGVTDLGLLAGERELSISGPN